MKGTGSEVIETVPAPLQASGVGLAAMVARVRNALRGAPKCSLVILALALICAMGAPLLAPSSPVVGELADALQPPGGAQHLLGTDHQGRDLLSPAHVRGQDFRHRWTAGGVCGGGVRHRGGRAQRRL